jgi:tRNA nucleotidyltransferase (CCA-adding enzyme)
MFNKYITEELKTLRAAFQARGFDIRLVGGAVRDIVAGKDPKDLDFCTDADPTEQLEIYTANGYKYVETGLQHGTITVVIDHVGYEITSLRTETDHDGRHATVAYTRDWMTDLSRRDFTFNAMSMTFDGVLIDPFGGQEDLRNQIVRFVGDADARIKEDYLRILRWFRFFGRFGHGSVDHAAMTAIRENAPGLSKISRERVWSEVKRIVQHHTGPELMKAMLNLGLFEHITMVTYWNANIGEKIAYWDTTTCTDAQEWTSDPEILMAAGQSWQEFAVKHIADNLKWSSEERDHARWLCKKYDWGHDLRWLIAVEDAPRKWVAELAAMESRDAWSQNALVHWHFDPFPVTGADLFAIGMKQGKAMGDVLRKLKYDWADSGYVATKEELLALVVV